MPTLSGHGWPFIGTWSSSVSYSRGDVVVRSGVLYQTVSDVKGTDPLPVGPQWVDVSAVIMALTGSIDPTAGDGIPVAIGTMYQMTGTGLYVKTGSGATAWAAAGGGGGLPTGWTQDAADPANVDSNGGNLTVANFEASLDGSFQGLVQVGNVMDAPQIRGGSGDPSAGLAAHVGSIYLRTNGQTWQKTGAGDTDWTQFGGLPAGAISVVRVPIAFDTASILTGITVYTPAAGDVLLDSSFVAVSTAWNATARLRLFSQGEHADDSNDMIGLGLGALLGSDGNSAHRSIISQIGANYISASGGQNISLDDTTPLRAIVDDGAGGAPGATAGALELVLIIAPAA